MRQNHKSFQQLVALFLLCNLCLQSCHNSYISSNEERKGQENLGKISASTHTQIASIQHSPKDLHYSARNGDLEEVGRLLEDKLSKTLFKGNHPYIASSLSNIGRIYSALGENEKALGYYEQALEMRKALFKGNHPSIERVRKNIARVKENQQKEKQSAQQDPKLCIVS